MAARAIASLSLSFGLVSIPVKLYSATEAATSIRFKLMGRGGTHVRQQYVSDAEADDPVPPPAALRVEPPPAHSRAATPSEAERAPEPESDFQDEDLATPRGAVLERQDMVKGYEFEKGKFVLFTPDELKALREATRDSIDIVAFIPEGSVDPLYYDKAYFVAPDRRGERPYALLLAAMRRTGRCALAKWAWRSKEYVVQIRPADPGLVLQQLRYADEVRSIADLDIPQVDVGEAEIALAVRLIEQISEDRY